MVLTNSPTPTPEQGGAAAREPVVLQVIRGRPHPLQEVLDAVGEALCAVDKDWRITLCNRHFADIYGFSSPGEMTGMSAFDVHPDFERSVFFEAMEDTMRTRAPHLRMGYSTRLNRWVFLRCYAFQDGVVLLLYDLQDVEAQQRVSFVSPHDPLTALPNRWALQRDMSQALRYHRSFSVTYVGLDRFKTVNDTLGHGSGDRVLMRIAANFKSCLHADDRLYRVGGDVFVLLSAATDAQLEERVGRLLREAAQPLSFEHYEFRLGASAGTAVCPGHGDDVETLLRRADIALYRAKHEARGTLVRFDARMEQERVQRVLLEQALRRAIDAGELEMCYQPKASLPQMRCIGFEALLRWWHPEMGLLLPEQFMPAAVESGLAADLDCWVLNRVAAELRMLRDAGCDLLPVAVNLSAESLSLPDLPQRVGAALAAHGLDHADLEIEVTESSLARDVEAAGAALRALVAQGATVSVDDFGTGYSSLAYLLRFPVQAVKIDRSFVQAMQNDEHSHTLVRSVIALAHSLRMRVIAEGVETDAQRLALIEMGCDAMQGYNYARPMALDELRQFYATVR